MYQKVKCSSKQRIIISVVIFAANAAVGTKSCKHVELVGGCVSVVPSL